MNFSLLLNQVTVCSATWLHHVTKPSEWIEAMLDLEIAEDQRASVLLACERDHRTIGSYYHWYLEKKLMARLMRRCKDKTALEALTRLDRTDLASLDTQLPPDRGCVIAIPHYGHYIPAAVSIVQHLSRYRDVAILYADPATHPGNTLFDRLCQAMSAEGECRATVLHANLAGLRRALGLLRRGGVLLMLPDAYLDLEETYTVPFFDQPLNVMLGSASLARKSDASLVPAIPLCAGAMAFTTRFGGDVRVSAQALPTGPSRHADLIQDYAATALLFQWYEQWMQGRTIHWQYVRQHASRQSSFPRLTSQSLKQLWCDLIDDPRSAPPLHACLHLPSLS